MTQHHLQLLQIGILLVFIGIIVIFISLITAATTTKEQEKEKSTFKFSVVGFLGFIPFGFGNDKKLLLFTAILTIIVAVATMILFSRSLKP
ncbi:DUF131 domain-containing protein [Candidatus Woesearchaeota archaeon]|nr:DUF131 domain-containing protein [Candidatus Woesearchaeota archaeon]